MTLKLERGSLIVSCQARADNPLHGPVFMAAMARAGFDVFAMSSRYEGLPCALVEAMRCGVPVVATAVNSVPDLVHPGETGLLVPPGRPRLLAAAIDRMLDDRTAATRMAAAARPLAGAPFDADRLGDVLAEVYRDGLRDNLEAVVR